MGGAVHEAMKMVAELGGKNPLFAVLANRVSNELLGEVISVAFGGINEIDAKRSAAVKQPIHVILGELLSPLAPKLPCANAYHGNRESRLAQSAIFHVHIIRGSRGSRHGQICTYKSLTDKRLMVGKQSIGEAGNSLNFTSLWMFQVN